MTASWPSSPLTRARRFRDRRDAGRALAERLEPLRNEHPVVLALPRGGVPVAFEVARALDAPLDVMVVRKLGVPFQPEVGMGAIGEEGARVLDPQTVHVAQVTPDELLAVEARERVELERRVRTYRGDRPMISLEGRTVIVVDDGIATGGTARAALQVARSMVRGRSCWRCRWLLPTRCTSWRVLPTPSSRWRRRAPFSRSASGTSVSPRRLTTRYGHCSPLPPPKARPTTTRRTTRRSILRVSTPRSSSPRTGSVSRATSLSRAAREGVVVFAHGSGSGRHSPRNQFVARYLQRSGLGTLLFDLLSPDEAINRANVFDVELLAVRLLAATRWVRKQPQCAGLCLGYFGASTGAAAALWAAAEDPVVGAVVSRGRSPRPRLAPPRRRAGSHVVHRGRRRQGGARAQPRSRRRACSVSIRSPSSGAPHTCSRSPAHSKPRPSSRRPGSSVTWRRCRQALDEVEKPLPRARIRRTVPTSS